MNFVPEFDGLEIALNGGTLTYIGQALDVGGGYYWSVQIIPTGGATTRSTAGTTRITNMPFAQTGLPCTCTAVNAGNIESYGVGAGSTEGPGTSMYMPSWAQTANGIHISGFCFSERA